MLPHNENILALLQAGPMAIEWNFAFEAWAGYVEELMALEAGAPFASLGIGQRRAASMPGVAFLQENGRPKVIQDPDLLHSEENTPDGAIAHLRLEGVMRSQDGMSSRGIGSLVSDINSAESNDKIEGILLEVNSGGGQAIAGQILNSAIASCSKPVIILGHFVASAAYMASVAADKIIASSAAAQFGSIGTMISIPRGLAANYNRWYQDMYASKSTNKNRAWRSFLEGDLTGLRESLEATNEAFHETVMSSRQLTGSETNISYTLSGEMFEANAAKRRGLLDAIGGIDVALNEITKAAKRRKMQAA